MSCPTDIKVGDVIFWKSAFRGMRTVGCGAQITDIVEDHAPQYVIATLKQACSEDHMHVTYRPPDTKYLISNEYFEYQDSFLQFIRRTLGREEA